VQRSTISGQGGCTAPRLHFMDCVLAGNAAGPRGCDRKISGAELTELREGRSTQLSRGWVWVARGRGSFCPRRLRKTEQSIGAEAAAQGHGGRGRDVVWREHCLIWKMDMGFLSLEIEPDGKFDRHRTRGKANVSAARKKPHGDEAAVHPPLIFAPCIRSHHPARWTKGNGDNVHVLEHSQGVYLLRADLWRWCLKLSVGKIYHGSSIWRAYGCFYGRT